MNAPDRAAATFAGAEIAAYLDERFGRFMTPAEKRLAVTATQAFLSCERALGREYESIEAVWSAIAAGGAVEQTIDLLERR